MAPTRSLSEAIRRTEPEAAVFVVPFTAQIRDTLVRERLMAMLSGFFGVIAVLLAFLGLYGVVAYGVTRRLRARSAFARRLVRRRRRCWGSSLAKACA